MTYTEARENIKSGDVLAWSYNGSPFKSWHNFQVWLVRLMQRSEYTHVGIAWRIAGRIFILEAVVPCVRIFPLSLCESFYHVDMQKGLNYDAEEFALSQIGEPYSKIEAIKAFFNQVRKGDSGTWQCAKYAAEVLRSNGIDYGEAFTPTSLVQAALADGKRLRYVTRDASC